MATISIWEVNSRTPNGEHKDLSVSSEHELVGLDGSHLEARYFVKLCIHRSILMQTKVALSCCTFYSASCEALDHSMPLCVISGNMLPYWIADQSHFTRDKEGVALLLSWFIGCAPRVMFIFYFLPLTTCSNGEAQWEETLFILPPECSKRGTHRVHSNLLAGSLLFQPFSQSWKFILAKKP